MLPDAACRAAQHHHSFRPGRPGRVQADHIPHEARIRHEEREKRTHTPDAAQLKELGLRGAKHQPHMPACEAPDPGNSRLEPSPPTPAEKALADSWKPRSPDPWADMAGEGGQAPTPAPKRVARAKVSAVAKGVIPTTLGGKLPPQSVLSRREFGLRALRR